MSKDALKTVSELAAWNHHQCEDNAQAWLLRISVMSVMMMALTGLEEKH